MYDVYNNLEQEILETAMQESLSYYKTQEKKPNVTLCSPKQIICTNEHKEECCAICKENFELEENIITLTCSHIFHSDCISEWIKYKSECPVCRKPIETKDIDDDLPEIDVLIDSDSDLPDLEEGSYSDLPDLDECSDSDLPDLEEGSDSDLPDLV